MAEHTDQNLLHQVIYSVFVRNHTKEGTFRALEGDLDRLKGLGADIIWLMPIHPIGSEGRKGTLGSPYAIQDYRGINPEYGTREDFIHRERVCQDDFCKFSKFKYLSAEKSPNISCLHIS